MTNPSMTIQDKKDRPGKKLTGLPKHWLVSAHLTSGAIWIGTAFCMVLIGLSSLKMTDGDELYAFNLAVKLLDDFVVIPSAIASVITGTLLCWLTVWGFFKFYWVIVKWVATLLLITFGSLWLKPWADAATSISQTERLKALINPLFMFDIKGATIGGSIVVASLFLIIAISIIKPWGRRDVARKAQT